jgi:small subunit ribosomal protein S1
MGEGIEGMIHVGDITRAKRLDHPRELLNAGQTVRAQVIEVDSGRRRFRLSIKNLEPTSVDTFIAEHSVGDEVTGRIVEVSEHRARVELAEGVTATCRIAKAASEQPAREPSRGKADLSSMTAMLAAKWKGSGSSESAAQSETNTLRSGQVRQFKIAGLDPSQKRIDLEVA